MKAGPAWFGRGVSECFIVVGVGLWDGDSTGHDAVISLSSQELCGESCPF